jgi:protein-arginine kinase activator protein McsA
MKIDRSFNSAELVVKESAKQITSDPELRKLSERLLKLGFDNQFERVERAKVREKINTLLDSLNNEV